MSLCNDCKHRRRCEDTSHSVEGCGDYQQEPNYKAIIADLLAALEGTVAELDRLAWVVCEQDSEAIEAVLTDARAAIAKAKGGSHEV